MFLYNLQLTLSKWSRAATAHLYIYMQYSEPKVDFILFDSTAKNLTQKYRTKMGF